MPGEGIDCRYLPGIGLRGTLYAGVYTAFIHMPVYSNIKFDRVLDESYFSDIDLTLISKHIQLAEEHIKALSEVVAFTHNAQ